MTSAAAVLRSQGHPVGEVFLSRSQIAARVCELGGAIAAAYDGEVPLLVAPLKSSAVFLADLSRAVPVQHELEVVQLSGYDGASGGARLVKDIGRPIAGRHVLVVEDAVDTGLTLSFLVRTLAERAPASVHAVALLDRPTRRLVDDLPLRFTGFTVPDAILCGYGLGLDERWRALPDLHLVDVTALPTAIVAA